MTAKAQELSPAVATACRSITTLLKKVELAQDQALHIAKKAEQYKRSIAQNIVAVRKERPQDWIKVIEAECKLKKSRVYALLAIADGKTTIAESRARNAEANRQFRDRQRFPSRDGKNPSRPDLLQEHIAELEAAREVDRDLVEQLRAAEIKIIGLESEIAELKAENAALRQQLAAARADPGPIPECLVRKPGVVH